MLSLRFKACKGEYIKVLKCLLLIRNGNKIKVEFARDEFSA